MNEYKSQVQIILDHLISGKSITALEALQKYGVMHLPRRIMDIEQLGHRISKETISVIKANGRRTHVTKYSYSVQNFIKQKVTQTEFQFQ